MFEECDSEPVETPTQGRPPLPSDPPDQPPSSDPPDDVASVPLARLESDICTLAGHLAAATCRWLVLVGEFDRRQAWASWGARSCGQWLSWRCGMGGGTAREHVRVGRALLEFPRIRAAFAAGRLTYSKVRALTRIATPELEQELVNLALGTTAAQVDRVVRRYRRAEDSETPPVPTPGTLRSSWNDDGTLTVTIRLSSDEGALLLAGIDAYDELLYRERKAGAAENPGGPGDNRDKNAATGRPPSDGVDGDCPVADMPRVSGPVAQAEALLAMVASALEHGPSDASGAERFEVVLHANVDQLRALSEEHPASAPDPVPQVSDPRPQSPLDRGRCHLANGPAVYPETLRRLACDARVRLMSHGKDGSPRDVGRRQRLVTAALRSLLEERDHGRCRFPTCSRRRRLHAHHIVHWADGGPTDLDNLVLLCPFHHQLVHESGFSVVGASGNRLAFHRPDGMVIAVSPATMGDPALDRPDPALHAAPSISAETTTPEWWGDPLHVADAVDGLLRRRAGSPDVPAGTSGEWRNPWDQPSAAIRRPEPAGPPAAQAA